MAESIGEGGATGRVIGNGSILTAGSLMRADICAVSAERSSSGSMRMSITASAVEGITFGPMPACSIVGRATSGGRVVDRLVLGQITLGRGGTLRVEQALVSRGLLWRADRRERSKDVRVVSLRRIGVSHVPIFSTALARCVTALSRRGVEPWPEVPVAISRTRRGTFSVVAIWTVRTRPSSMVAPFPSAMANSASMARIPIHHEANANAGWIGFFAGFGQENHIPVEPPA